MPLNFIIKISKVACRGTGLKFKSCHARTFHSHLRRVLPNSVIFAEFDKQNSRKVKVCNFHVSSPRSAPPILIFLRYFAKIGAIISGRLIRKWWSKLSPEEKEHVLSQIRSRKTALAMMGTIFVGGVFIYYIEHMIEDPITKRKRFMMLNQKQINQLAEFEYQQQLRTFRSEIVPAYHPTHRRVARVANTLILSNADIPEIRDKVWTVTVIDRANITNAFALSHGKIFVFTGMLNICTNDDQLAMVLAHEISHSILSHVAESLSKIFFVEFILLIPSLVFWSIFPDMWALFSEWVMTGLAKLFIHLPFSREIEREADIVGLKLAAKSCYDVREAPVFWGKMKLVSSDMPLEWLSTHPRHESRQHELMELVPAALKVREMNKCPPLGTKWF